MKYLGTLTATIALALTAASSLGEGGPHPKEPRAATREEAKSDLAAIGPAPAELVFEVEESDRTIMVRARRRGSMVALLGAGARAAGEESAKLSIDRAALSDPTSRTALADGRAIVWETSELGKLEVERGMVAVILEDGTVRASASSAAAPSVAEKWSGSHHVCEAHDDALGGYAVLCRLDGAARDASVASLTTVWPNDDVAIAKSKRATTVRIDLPLDGASESASSVVSFHVGRTGFMLDVDATDLAGETRAITMSELSRDQPVASDEAAAPVQQRGNNRPSVVSGRTR